MAFEVGDKVHVEFDAFVSETAHSTDGRLFTYTLTEVGRGATHYVYLTDYNAEVTEPAAPASWPPQVGDVWEANGNEYFAYQGIFGGVTVYPFEGTGVDLGYYESDGADPDRSLNSFKGLKPTLVRRRNEPKITVNLTTARSASHEGIDSYLKDAARRYSSGGRFA